MGGGDPSMENSKEIIFFFLKPSLICTVNAICIIYIGDCVNILCCRLCGQQLFVSDLRRSDTSTLHKQINSAYSKEIKIR